MTNFSAEFALLFSQYQNFILLIVITFFLGLIMTPISGVLAYKLDALDKPAKLRDRSDLTRNRRIHEKITPRLGGVAIALATGVGVFLAWQAKLFIVSEQAFLQISIGVLILLFLGIRDSIVDVPAKSQLLLQVFAALLVTTAGIKINFIEMLGVSINFDVINFTVPLGALTLQFSPLADLVTIIWIVGLINAINWVDGMDGIAAAIIGLAALTLMLIGVKFSSFFAAAIAAALVGSIAGYFPFSYPPAKTFIGSTASTSGFILSILAIISGAKLSYSIIILAVPIIDAVWVLIGRLRTHKGELKSPLDLLKISDKTHLHHRLLAIGLDMRQALMVEIMLVLVFCLIAYSLAGFSDEALIMISAVILCLAIFVVIGVLQRRAQKRQPPEIPPSDSDGSQREVKLETITAEEKYAY